MAGQTTAVRTAPLAKVEGAGIPGALRSVGRFCRKRPLGAIGGFIVVFLLFVAIFSNWLMPRDPYEINTGSLFQAPSSAYPFGTDDFGRDILSRVIYGARISVIISFVAIATSTILGTVFGLIAGYAQGWLDNLIMRIMDVVLAFPTIVLAMAMVAILGPSLRNVTIALAFVQLPTVARLVRSAVLTEKQNQYVEAAQSVGANNFRIVARHLLPNVMAPIVVISTVNLGFAILTEATLSFLGLGEPPPTPSWGQMLGGKGRDYFEVAPWMPIFPGLAITIAVLGFNLLGDALRDEWDPRLRGSR